MKVCRQCGKRLETTKGMKIHYVRMPKTDREERGVIAWKNSRIKQRRQTMRESVKERKEDDAKHATR